MRPHTSSDVSTSKSRTATYLLLSAAAVESVPDALIGSSADVMSASKRTPLGVWVSGVQSTSKMAGLRGASTGTVVMLPIGCHTDVSLGGCPRRNAVQKSV